MMRTNNKDNLSAVFLLPGLQIKETLKAKFHELGFLNSYMFSERHVYSSRIKPVYLLFRPRKFNMEFYNFGLGLEKNQNYIETIDLPRGEVLYVFRFPLRFDSDYHVFCRGKYSKFSNEYKACFPLKEYVRDEKGQFVKDPEGRWITQYTDFHHIFNKTDELKRRWLDRIGEDAELPDELFDKYDSVKETLPV